MCKMENVTTFTQFKQKITHINECKLVYKYTIAKVTVHICTVTVEYVFIILFISVRTFFYAQLLQTMYLLFYSFQFAPFFSLFSMHNELRLLIFFLRCTQTHPHRQINTKTHPHTNKPTQTNQQRDRSMLDWNQWAWQF